MTPYEAWTGRKPQVGGLRVFGCQAFVHIPKEERKKLEMCSFGIWIYHKRISTL